MHGRGLETLMKAVCKCSTMVVTWHRAGFLALTRAAIPGTVEVSFQTEVRREKAAFQVWGCREHLGPLTGAGVRGDELLACRRCALVADL